MVKRKLFISKEAFDIVRIEKQKMINIRKKNPKRYKFKRLDDAYVFDKILGLR